MPDEYTVILGYLLARAGISPEGFSGAVLASVVPPLVSTWSQACKDVLGISPLVVEAGIKTGIRVLVDNPREVGADRVAHAIAGFRLYGGPTIVVDFGTATVFDSLSPEGDYLGGAIAP